MASGELKIGNVTLVWKGLDPEMNGEIQLLKPPQADRTLIDDYLADRLERYFKSKGSGYSFSTELKPYPYKSWNQLWALCQRLGLQSRQPFSFKGYPAPPIPKALEVTDLVISY